MDTTLFSKALASGETLSLVQYPSAIAPSGLEHVLVLSRRSGVAASVPSASYYVSLDFYRDLFRAIGSRGQFDVAEKALYRWSGERHTPTRDEISDLVATLSRL